MHRICAHWRECVGSPCQGKPRDQRWSGQLERRKRLQRSALSPASERESAAGESAAAAAAQGAGLTGFVYGVRREPAPIQTHFT